MKTCRFCDTPLEHIFIDMENAPLPNSFLMKGQLYEKEIYYPLKVFVCHKCLLVQTDDNKKPEEMFNKVYPYFSSFSKSWLEHVKAYVDMISSRLTIDGESFVVEIASNDGYMLQYFKRRGIPCLGIEPSSNSGEAARKKGIESINEFFGEELAYRLSEKGRKADLLIGNNVLAHVPEINDFVAGMKVLLAENGTITMEFPHLMQLVENNQFDTIYHEHFSYFSFRTVLDIFSSHDLTVFDVEKIPTHGGSLRIFAGHKGDETKPTAPAVAALLSEEDSLGMYELHFYTGFQQKADKVKYDLLDFLIQKKRKGQEIAAYGAAAKGNTLLNYCGIKRDLVNFVAEISPLKQGKFMPGSHIPVVTEDFIKMKQPDYILILPWNLKDEISEQLDYVRAWGGKFVTAVPELRSW